MGKPNAGGGYGPASGNTEDDFRGLIGRVFTDQDLAEILATNKRDYHTHIEKVKRFVELCKDDITSSQLRNVFSQVKAIHAYEKLFLLRPKLAYTYGRQDEKKRGMKALLLMTDDLIKNVKSKEQLEQFKLFLESVIAYHKFYGGN